MSDSSIPKAQIGKVEKSMDSDAKVAVSVVFIIAAALAFMVVSYASCQKQYNTLEDKRLREGEKIEHKTYRICLDAGNPPHECRMLR